MSYNIISHKWLSSFFFMILVVLISSISSTSCSSTTPTKSSAQALLVPKSKTFRYIIQEPLSYPMLEYGDACIPLDIKTYPFQLFFYRIRPHAYVFALGVVTSSWYDIDDGYRWVWTANPGNPVHENATLSFGRDGNLVLKDADGRVAWETGTSNKGVVDLKLLPNGNLVLLDKNGGFVWKSFNHPTDTLLVGQTLTPGGNNNKLVSRLTKSDDSEGQYNMVLEESRLAFYYNAPPPQNNKPLLYYDIPLLVQPVDDVALKDRRVKNVTFTHIPSTTKEYLETDLLRLEFFNNIDGWGPVNFAQQKYDSRLSFLRLGLDGILRAYTWYDASFYYEGAMFRPWEVTYTTKIECQLPEKCGSLGLCRNNRCVACPTPQGLKNPWSKRCQPPKLPSCRNINETTNV